MAILLLSSIVIIMVYIQLSAYKKNCFKGVSAGLKFKDEGVFEGEKTVIIEAIGNKKWLTLWWLLVEYKVSGHLLFKDNGDFTVANSDANYRKDLFSLSPYQKVIRSYEIKAAKRGYYTIDNVSLKAGDLFGINKFLTDMPVFTSLYVYPALISVNEPDTQFERMIGEIITRRRLIDDPFQIRGIRDYMEFDSLKTVNWNATARCGQLKVNEYDYTSSREVMILLNIEKFNAWDGDGTIEESIRIAASLASECIKGGIPTGLISNGCSCITKEGITLDISGSPGYSQVFYQSLACLDTKSITCPFCDTIREIGQSMNKLPLYVLISQYFGRDLEEEIQNARAKGFSIYWIIPKYHDTKLKFQNQNDIFVWEVEQK